MKNKYFIRMALGLVILITTIVVISCSEKETTQPAQHIENASSFETSIQHFMNHWLQNYKTSSQMLIDAALDSFELALNYKYGDATFQFSEFIIDTSKVQCQQLYDSISNYDLLAAYNKCVDSLGVQYDRVDATSKQLVWAMITLDTIIGTTVNISVIGGFGNGINVNPQFGIGDDWIWGMDLGKCDGTMVGLDAADPLMETVNSRKPPILNGHAIITYLIESQDFYGSYIYPYDFLNPNDPIPNDYYRDFLMFSDKSLQIYCLDYNEMNFYLNGLETILYQPDPKGICPSGFSFINVYNMFGDYCFGNLDNVHVIENAFYGKIEYVSHAPDSL